MSRAFYLIFLLVSLQLSSCFHYSNDDDRIHHQIFRRPRNGARLYRRVNPNMKTKVANPIDRKSSPATGSEKEDDLLASIDLASFMQRPSYERKDKCHYSPTYDGYRQPNLRNNKRRVKKLFKHEDNFHLSDTRNFRQNANEIDDFKFDHYKMNPFSLTNNRDNRYSDDVINQSPSITGVPITVRTTMKKRVYKGITFPFFSHNKSDRTDHNKTKRNKPSKTHRNENEMTNLIGNLQPVIPDFNSLDSDGPYNFYKTNTRTNRGLCQCDNCKKMRENLNKHLHNKRHMNTGWKDSHNPLINDGNGAVGYLNSDALIDSYNTNVYNNEDMNADELRMRRIRQAALIDFPSSDHANDNLKEGQKASETEKLKQMKELNDIQEKVKSITSEPITNV